MRYEIQWFPPKEEKYNIGKLEKAVAAIPITKDVQVVPYYDRYASSQTISKTKPEAVQFTMPTLGYEGTKNLVDQVKLYLAKSTRSKDPQVVTIRAISMAERKKITKKKAKIKRKPRCGCK